MQSIFGFVIYPMELGLTWLASNVGSAGIAIILFTILVRLVLSPLQITQLRNAKSMQKVQPLIAELRQKHGKDRQKLTEETMALYREHKVNPAMGCLPTLLQFPILIGLFYALLHLGQSPTGWPTHIVWKTITCDGNHVSTMAQWFKTCYAVKNASGSPSHIFDLFHATFLWLSKGLGEPDPLYILPVLAGVTQWVQSRMMLTKSVDPQQQMMNTMMNFMPLMIVFFATRYPSGLSLYWVTSTLIGIAIQYKITGLGLLPETLSNLGKMGSLGSLQRAAVGTPRASRERPAAGKPVRSVKPVDAGTIEVDGQNGAADETNGAVTVIRPRKKANRARGGRSGRRG